MTLWFVVTAVLCFASFYIGRLSGSHDVVTYSVNGIPTSFNAAQPTYGLQFFTPILMELRDGHTTNALNGLENLTDMMVYEAMFRRPLLQGQGLAWLDRDLTEVARYRERFPRPTSYPTNATPAQIAQWQKLADYIRDFPK